MDQDQTSKIDDRICGALKCAQPIATNRFMCQRCWVQVPMALKRNLAASWTPGQGPAGGPTPSAAWNEAAAQCRFSGSISDSMKRIENVLGFRLPPPPAEYR